MDWAKKQNQKAEMKIDREAVELTVEQTWGSGWRWRWWVLGSRCIKLHEPN